MASAGLGTALAADPRMANGPFCRLSGVLSRCYRMLTATWNGASPKSYAPHQSMLRCHIQLWYEFDARRKPSLWHRNALMKPWRLRPLGARLTSNKKTLAALPAPQVLILQ